MFHPAKCPATDDTRLHNSLDLHLPNSGKLFEDQAKKLEAQFAIRALAVLSKADVEYKSAKNQRLLVEMALMQISSIKSELEK